MAEPTTPAAGHSPAQADRSQMTAGNVGQESASDRSCAVSGITLPAPYYTDDSVTLHNGDALAVLAAMPDESVNCIVTSPPYFGLRDYGIEGQYGLEASPTEYAESPPFGGAR